MLLCIVSLLVDVSIDSKMRSHSHSTDIEQKLKSMISKPNSSDLLRKVLLTQQNQNNLFASTSLTANIDPSSTTANSNNNEHPVMPVKVNSHNDAIINKFQDSSENLTASIPINNDQSDDNPLCTFSSNNEDGLTFKPVPKLPLPVISSSSLASASTQIYIPSPIYSPTRTVNKPPISDNDSTIPISDLVMENSANSNNNEHSVTPVKVSSHNDAIKKFHDFQITSENSTIPINVQSDNNPLCTFSRNNADGLNCEPIPKLPLPVISSSSLASASTQIYIPSPIYSPTHTINKPPISDNDSTIPVSDLLMEDSANSNNNERSVTTVKVKSHNDAIINEFHDLSENLTTSIPINNNQSENNTASEFTSNNEDGLTFKPVPKLPYPVISSSSIASVSTQIYIPSPIYSPTHTITKPPKSDNDSTIPVSDLLMEDSANSNNNEHSVMPVKVNSHNDAIINEFHDLSENLTTSISINNDQSENNPASEFTSNNEDGLTFKPVPKLPLPVISSSCLASASTQIYIPSPIYSPTHTITKPPISDNDSTIPVSDLTLDDSVKTRPNNIEDLNVKGTQKTIVNTRPKLYSMIANNTGKRDRINYLMDKLDKPATLLKTYLSDNIITTSATTLQHQQVFQESPSSLHDIHIPIVTLVDSDFKYGGDSISVDTFSDNLKSLAQNSNTQTLLLALPENFNVSQFSNQTLNLDAHSQQILRSLLLEPTVISLDHSENKREVSEDSVLCVDETLNSSSDSDGESEPDKEYLAMNDSSVIDKLSDEKTVHSILRFNSIIQKDKAVVNSCPGIDNLENADSVATSDNHPDINSNPLPVATINVDMIGGQPMYTIQIMGQNIPLAAITIPTSDGPLYLQSATSTAPSNQVGIALNQASEANCTYTIANEDSTVITTAKESSTCSTTVKPKFTCQICGKSYIRSWSYYGHLRLHSGEIKKHTCAICKESFAFPTDLKDHMMTHSDEERGVKSKSSRKYQNNGDKNSFVCSIPDCDKTLGNASALKIHQRVHQEEKPYKCTFEGCNKSFKTPSELSRHQFRHTGEKPYKCDQCEKAFVRNDDLKRHYFIHTGQKRFHCDQCDFSCIQSFDLVKHKYIHGGEKPYKCKSCSKQFTRPARLREHERLHTGERPYTCDLCGKSFTQLTSLKSHKLAHSQKPIPCDKCDKMFTNTIELQDHMNTHLGTKPFQCLLCNKMFVSEKTLKRHAIVHTGEKPFECKICKKKFARSSDLKVHLPVHEENKPYKCNECSKMFTRYSSLKEHLRLHTGELPFSCNICHKIFNHRSHLNVHMHTHTGEKPHKCSFCPKEFSRKANLNIHLRIHGADKNSAVKSDDSDNDDGNISDSSTIGDHETVNLDTLNVSVLIQNALKRKRDESLENNDEFLSSKRHMTEEGIVDYTEQVISNLARDQPHLQVGEVTVVDTSSLSSILQGENQVIVTQLTSDQLAPLADNLMNNDYGTVVALGLGSGQVDSENLVVENLIQLNRFDAVQELNRHAFERPEGIQSVDEEQITEWEHEE